MHNRSQLYRLLEKQREIMSMLVEILLQERAAIVNNDAISMQKYATKKEEQKLALETIEQQRSDMTPEKSLSEIIAEAEQVEKDCWTALQIDLKAKAREVQALSKANVLLLRSTVAHLNQLHKMVYGEGKQSYDRAGEMPGSSFSGKFLSSSA